MQECLMGKSGDGLGFLLEAAMRRHWWQDDQAGLDSDRPKRRSGAIDLPHTPTPMSSSS